MNNSSIPTVLQMYLWFASQPNIKDIPTNYHYLQTIGIERNDTKCYGVYGCFSLAQPWTYKYRPLSVFPVELEMLRTAYTLYTRKNPKIPRIMDLDDPYMIEISKIDPDMKLYVIAHGFLDDGNESWVQDLKSELLLYEDCSVIVVDWGFESSPPYPQAVANIRLIGAMTAHLLGAIAEETIDNKLDHVHAIGHSLGAHLCGYIGYTLQEIFGITLGRITGLDPAYPHFSHAQPPVRLDRTAAHYVDVIHSDVFDYAPFVGLGLTENIGHVDFFPNGGTKQPGCRKPFSDIIEIVACDHIRSYQFFTESIRSTCPFMSITCNSFEAFEAGECIDCNKAGQYCVKFGFHSRENYERLIEEKNISNETNLTTYLMTGPSPPFCGGHYRITMKLSQEFRPELCELFVTVFNDTAGTGQSLKFAMKYQIYEPGKEYRATFFGETLENVGSAEVEIGSALIFLNPTWWKMGFKLKVHVDWITVETMETRKMYGFAGKSVSRK